MQMSNVYQAPEMCVHDNKGDREKERARGRDISWVKDINSRLSIKTLVITTISSPHISKY